MISNVLLTPINVRNDQKWVDFENQKLYGEDDSAAIVMGRFLSGRMTSSKDLGLYNLISGPCYPTTPAAFGRCLKVMHHFSEWNQRKNQLKSISKAWTAIVDCWKLASLYYDKIGDEFIPKKDYESFISELLSSRVDHALDPDKSCRDQKIKDEALSIIGNMKHWFSRELKAVIPCGDVSSVRINKCLKSDADDHGQSVVPLENSKPDAMNWAARNLKSGHGAGNSWESTSEVLNLNFYDFRLDQISLLNEIIEQIDQLFPEYCANVPISGPTEIAIIGVKLKDDPINSYKAKIDPSFFLKEKEEAEKTFRVRIMIPDNQEVRNIFQNVIQLPEIPEIIEPKSSYTGESSSSTISEDQDDTFNFELPESFDEIIEQFGLAPPSFNEKIALPEYFREENSLNLEEDRELEEALLYSIELSIPKFWDS